MIVVVHIIYNIIGLNDLLPEIVVKLRFNVSLLLLKSCVPILLYNFLWLELWLQALQGETSSAPPVLRDYFPSFHVTLFVMCELEIPAWLSDKKTKRSCVCACVVCAPAARKVLKPSQGDAAELQQPSYPGNSCRAAGSCWSRAERPTAAVPTE